MMKAGTKWNVILVLAPLVLLAAPARAENWVDVGEWLMYDADSATYDSADDVVVVDFIDADWGNETWGAYSCASDDAWEWYEVDKTWDSYTLNDLSEDYALLRNRLCGMKTSLPYKDF